MAENTVSMLNDEGNNNTTAPAIINYTNMDGDHITTQQAFGDALDELAWSLEEEATEPARSVRRSSRQPRQYAA